jgi:hypothetical protein
MPAAISAVLTDAVAINASGQIAGNGRIDGFRFSEPVLLTSIADVPVPAALPLMLGGIGLLAGLARRSSKHVAQGED